jgi:hypothetical protein
MTSIAFRANSTMIRRQFGSLLAKASANSAGNHFLVGHTPPIGIQNSTNRAFSHANVGSITTPLQKLDQTTVRRIEDELRQVDKDSDGR